MNAATLVDLNDSQSVNQALNSLYKVGLAGLGACARVQQETNTLFKVLVTKGEEAQARLNKQVSGQVNLAEERLEGAVKEAKGTWNKAGSILQGSLSQLLRQLGIASRNDIDKLSQLVEKLDHSVLELSEARKFNGPSAV
ncbi:MAG: phasin family protein [Candidatus Competibacteraceae bacterium]|jgi:poly(hydroxyalkanoate) granule-associated protein|nr:phasin family protein [Candidatus Competibacteraceae bacterium]